MGRRRLRARHELQQQSQRGEVRPRRQRGRRGSPQLARSAAGRPYHRLGPRTEPPRPTSYPPGPGCARKLSPHAPAPWLGPGRGPRAAGALGAGGHSTEDAGPKYGLAVGGPVHPDRVFTNAGAQAGDDLVLTKPIGLGVISTAVKRDAATPELVEEAVRVMTALNADARDAALELGDAVHAATDVTGFGLLGHARELLAA